MALLAKHLGLLPSILIDPGLVADRGASGHYIGASARQSRLLLRINIYRYRDHKKTVNFGLHHYMMNI